MPTITPDNAVIDPYQPTEESAVLK